MPDPIRSLPQFTKLYYHGNPTDPYSGTLVHTEFKTYLVTPGELFLYNPGTQHFHTLLSLAPLKIFHVKHLTNKPTPHG